MNKKGFTMLEMLVSLLILSLSSLLVLKKEVEVDTASDDFVAEYNYIHAKALSEGGSEYDNPYSSIPIRFNENGNINQGQSFYIGKRRIVIRPMTGNIRVE